MADNCCSILFAEICTRNGDDVFAQALIFETAPDVPYDISTTEFFYESNGVGFKDLVKKSLGDGLTILDTDTNKLIIERYTETRKPGHHVAYLKAVDQDGEETIFSWKITVQQKQVSVSQP